MLLKLKLITFYFEGGQYEIQIFKCVHV